MAESHGEGGSAFRDDRIINGTDDPLVSVGERQQQTINMLLATFWVVVQPCCLVLVGTAFMTLVFGCWRAWVHHHHHQFDNDDVSQFSLTHRHAMWIPVLSSCALLAMFFLFSYIQHILLLSVLISAVYSLSFSVSPLVHSATVRMLVMSLVAVMWLYTGHWVLNNVIAAAMCITFLSHVRLPNFKTCAMLLGALFFYDIFWVFFSSRIFGSNVMTEAAEKRADNVAVRLAESISGRSFDSFARDIDLPTKFKVPVQFFIPNQDHFIMLGAGDVAMPGLLLVLGMLADASRQSHRKPSFAVFIREYVSRQRIGGKYKYHSYTLVGLVGYLCGLFAALVSGIFFQVAQPALLYLVPSTLVPMYAQGVRNGDDWQSCDDEQDDQQSKQPFVSTVPATCV